MNHRLDKVCNAKTNHTEIMSVYGITTAGGQIIIPTLFLLAT